MAAEKRTGLLAESMGVSERHNMAFAGATITSGRGTGIAVATGSGTQVGMIAETVAESESAKPPLVLRMEKFIRHISLLVVLISAGLALLLHFQGYEPAEIFFFVVALAISAIPEGLPVALTVALSIATKGMSKRDEVLTRGQPIDIFRGYGASSHFFIFGQSRIKRCVPGPEGPTVSTVLRKLEVGVMPEPKLIELALQGGGAHGAYTWGVLDRLLEDDRVKIEGISGTSAGAMNAVVVADGLDRGGKDGARGALNRFWRRVSEAGRYSPFQRTLFDRLLGRWTLDYSPGYLFWDMLSRLVSPYEVNPLGLNSVKSLIENLVDFSHVRHAEGIKLFVAATNVRTGKLKIFRREEMTADMIMASACLPFIFQAVEIDGEAYWDGGYMGNPALFPLVEQCEARDLVIVQINPIYRDEIPRRASDILNRINEITFNASLIKEVRSISLLKKLIEVGNLEDQFYKDALFHRINADVELEPLSVSSKLNTEWAFLEHLHDVGYRTTGAWLDENFEHIGNRSTLDIESVYLQT